MLTIELSKGWAIVSNLYRVRSEQRKGLINGKKVEEQKGGRSP